MKQSMNKKSLQTINKNHSMYQPTKLLYFFITLGVIQAIVIVLGIIAIVWVSQLKGDEAVGGNLVVGVLLSFALMAAAVLALVNVIGIPIYIARHRPRRKWLIYGILSLAISTLPLVYGAILGYQLFVEIPATSQRYQQELQQIYDDDGRDNISGSDDSFEIPKDHAIEKLRLCDISVLYYSDHPSENDKQWAEHSSTGVVMTYEYLGPPSLSVASWLAPELISITKDVRQRKGTENAICNGPTISHDGITDSLQDDGSWR